jgi:solute carrier family 25 uncoupling protein 27
MAASSDASKHRIDPYPASKSVRVIGAYLTACFAATVSETVTYPLDLLKTRLQLQNERGRALGGGAAGVPLTLTQMTRKVVATEGVRSLFAGLSVAVARQWLNAGVSVVFYSYIRRAMLADGEDGMNAPLWKRAAAGAISGCIAQALAQPADIVKVRLQADGRLRASGGVPRYNGAAHAFREIVRVEGWRGLYVAFGSSVWRAAIIQSAGIASYDHTKQWATEAVGGNYAPQTIASFVTGVVSAVVSAPLDIVKTRIINTPERYKGPNDALMSILRTEGAASMWKGLLPTYQRQALWNGIFWMMLEEGQRIMGQERL